jgi:putative transposase
VQDDRERSGREASPTLMIVDAQSVKSGPNRGGKKLMKSGYDGGKKVLGAKRHAVVDVRGNLLGVLVTPANADDRSVAAVLLAILRPLFPFVKLILGDTGYNGPNMADAAAKIGDWRFEIEKRSDAASGFKPNRRWPVERTFAFVGLCRRLARNYERYAQTAEAWFKLAAARIHLRRLPAAA